MFDLLEVMLPTFSSLGVREALGFCFILIGYLFWRNRKLGRRIDGLNKPKSPVELLVSGYVLVRPSALDGDVPVGAEFVVPSVFPPELAGYVKHATLAEIAKWSLDLAAEGDEDKRNAIRRAITIGAAINRTYVPLGLTKIDEHTKLLWRRYKLDTERVKGQLLEALRVVSAEGFNEPVIDKMFITQYVGALVKVGGVVGKYSTHWTFPTLKVFSDVVRNQVMVQERRYFTDEVIASMVTAYSIRVDVKIPRSYLRYDRLTFQLVAALDEKDAPRLKLVVSDEAESADA